MSAFTDIERCRREIAAIVAELLAGNPDVEGLCLALSDWSAELGELRRRKGLVPLERLRTLESTARHDARRRRVPAAFPATSSAAPLRAHPQLRLPV